MTELEKVSEEIFRLFSAKPKEINLKRGAVNSPIRFKSFMTRRIHTVTENTALCERAIRKLSKIDNILCAIGVERER